MSNYISTEDFLAHYGMLGMKWGVHKSDEQIAIERKSNSEKETLTPAQRKFLITGGITLAIGAVAVSSILVYKGPIKYKLALSKATSELDSMVKNKSKLIAGKNFMEQVDDVVIPKGGVFHRVASQLENEISSPKYATYIDKDVMQYRKGWSNFYNIGDKKAKTFATKFEALSDAKVASPFSMKKIGEEALDKVPSDGGKTLRELIFEDHMRYNKKDPVSVAKVTEDFSAWTPKKTIEYLMGIKGGGAWTDETSKRFLSELKDAGYAGFTDIVDTGRMQHAVVLMNNEIFRTTGTILTAAERKAAKALLNTLY